MQVCKSWEELLYFLPKHSQNLFLLTYQFLRLHVVVLCPAYLDVLQLRLLFTAAEDTIYARIKLMLR